MKITKLLNASLQYIITICAIPGVYLLRIVILGGGLAPPQLVY